MLLNTNRTGAHMSEIEILCVCSVLSFIAGAVVMGAYAWDMGYGTRVREEQIGRAT